jgi:hypothetical protein
MKAAALAGQRLCWFELKKQQARPFRFLGVGNRLPPRRPSRRRLVAAPQDEGRFAPRGKPLPWPSNSIFGPLDQKFWLCQTEFEVVSPTGFEPVTY